MSTYHELGFFEFQERFKTEEDCFEYLVQSRWPEGFECPRCGHDRAYIMQKRKVFQCAECRHQTSVTAGTIFHRTHAPLRKWFWAIYLVGSDKRGCSAKQLEKMIDVHYTTAWLMIHKIRKAMRDRDSLYRLEEDIEMDDSYFGGASKGKRGRGAGNKSPVIVAVEYRGSENPILKTDGYSSYKVLDATFKHLSDIVRPDEAMKKLPWVHILLGNVKNFIRGTYHGVSHKHLQSYLSEFCYRFNRRYNNLIMTDRLLAACLNATTITYAELTR